jgi:hypothetical protein
MTALPSPHELDMILGILRRASLDAQPMFFVRCV